MIFLRLNSFNPVLRISFHTPCFGHHSGLRSAICDVEHGILHGIFSGDSSWTVPGKLYNIQNNQKWHPTLHTKKKSQKDIIHVPSRELTWGKGTSSSKVTFDGICGRSQEGTSIWMRMGHNGWERMPGGNTKPWSQETNSRSSHR